jgi:hypothetical protein
MPRETVTSGAMNYVPLRQVLDDFMVTMDADDYLSNVSDYAIRNVALRGIREFGFDVTSKVRSLKLTVDSNSTVTLPDDYVDLIKIGVISDGIIYVLGENKNIALPMTYDTAITTADTDQADDGVLNLPTNIIQDRTRDYSDTAGSEGGGDNDYDFYVFQNYLYQGGLGRLYGSGGGHRRGEYRIDLDQNRIEISSESGVTEVVLEYVSDEARNYDPVVHVYAEEALRCYIYYKLCERKMTVPAGEKGRARQEYYNERRKAKGRMSNFTKEEALKTIRQNFKQSPKY